MARVLIYGINYAPEATGVGKYTGELAEWLASRGHAIRVVTAPPYYPAWRVAAGHEVWRYARETRRGVEVLRCPLWVPKKPTAAKRVLHLLSFALASAPVVLAQARWRPDVVLAVEPPLFGSPVALLAARLAKAAAWLHVQDFEVAAFFGLGGASRGPLGRGAAAVEGWLMRRFDRVSSISEAMVGRLAGLGVPADRISLLPNWVDTRAMHPDAKGRDFRREWGLPPAARIVLYAGSMGNKQEFETVLHAARVLEKDRPDLLFLLVGEGPAKSHLLERVRHLGLRNVVFQPPQSGGDLPALLDLADVHLVVQKRGGADAYLPSKLGGILAVGGIAVVTADADTALGRLVAGHPGIAVLVPPGDPVGLREGVLEALRRRAESPGGNRIAREYATRYLAADVVLPKFERMLGSPC